MATNPLLSVHCAGPVYPKHYYHQLRYYSTVQCHAVLFVALVSNSEPSGFI